MIHTYLAWQDPPDTQYLGLANKMRLFDNIEAESRQFVQWFERRFASPAMKRA